MNLRFVLTLAAAAVGLKAMPSAGQSPVGTALMYQGELSTSGQPAAGHADLRFGLFIAPTGGTQVGTTIERLSVPLAQGRFAQELDFGPAAFGAEARWMEIAVRSPAGAGSYVTLVPRQRIAPAPVAQFAARPWETSGSVISYSGGFVGIGTAAPISRLTIDENSDQNLDLVLDSGLTAPRTSAVSLFDRGVFKWSLGKDSTNAFYIAQAATGIHRFRISEATGATTINGVLSVSGNVGIGTASPLTRLHVDGDISMGPGGLYRAAGGEENLRMIRGNIGPSGNIISGAGFTVVRDVTGFYLITFNVPFADTPTVTATVDATGSGSVSMLAMTNSISTNHVRVVLRDPEANTYRDGEFRFIAIGPR